MWRDFEVLQMPEFKEYAARLKAHVAAADSSDALAPTILEFAPDVAQAFYALSDRVSGLQQVHNLL